MKVLIGQAIDRFIVGFKDDRLGAARSWQNGADRDAGGAAVSQAARAVLAHLTMADGVGAAGEGPALAKSC